MEHRAISQPAIWFTPKERQVLELTCEAKQAKQIAIALQMSPAAVYFHRASMRKKLHVENDAELMLWGLKHPEDVYRGCTREPGLKQAA